MASTKELFASAINYILRDIKDCDELIATGEEYLQRVELKLTTGQKEKTKRQIAKIKNDIAKIKDLRKKHERELKYWKNYWSFTDEEMNNKAKGQKFHIHPATDEEIARDYEQDLKEKDYNGRYTEQDHRTLIDKVNELNKIEDLPLLSY